jgi:hypothetical protein
VHEVFSFFEGENMIRGSRPLRSLLLTSALAFATAAIGCSHPHYVRVYDPYYSDYHVWNDTEITFYNRWCVETHHDPHIEFRTLSEHDKKEYWTWRHNHGG